MNRQYLIEVFKMYNGLSLLKQGELFIVNVNVRGDRGHFGNQLNFGVLWTAASIFFK